EQVTRLGPAGRVGQVDEHCPYAARRCVGGDPVDDVQRGGAWGEPGGDPVDDVPPPVPKLEGGVTELCAGPVGEHDSRCVGGAGPTGLEPDPALLGLVQEPQLDLFEGAGDIERRVSWETDRPGFDGALVDRARRVQQLGGGEGRPDELTGPGSYAGGRTAAAGWW